MEVTLHSKHTQITIIVRFYLLLKIQFTTIFPLLYTIFFLFCAQKKGKHITRRHFFCYYFTMSFLCTVYV